MKYRDKETGDVVEVLLNGAFSMHFRRPKDATIHIWETAQFHARFEPVEDDD